MIGLVHVDLEACAEQAVADRWPELIDGVAGWTESVEFACRAIDDIVSDQGVTSGQEDPFCFGEREDQRCNPLPELRRSTAKRRPREGWPALVASTPDLAFAEGLHDKLIV